MADQHQQREYEADEEMDLDCSDPCQHCRGKGFTLQFGKKVLCTRGYLMVLPHLGRQVCCNPE